MKSNIKLFAGPLAALLVWGLPLGIPQDAQTMAGIFSWVVLWWVLEPMPLPITSIVGVLLAVIFGITDVRSAFAKFADPVIFLILGSFLLAQAMSRHGLVQRVTIHLLSTRFVERKPQRSVLLLFAMTCVLSALLPNSATMAIVLPVGMALLHSLYPHDKSSQIIGLLGLSYATSIGGMITPIGTPPNLLTMANLQNLAGIQVSFLGWVLAAFPYALGIALFVGWMLKSGLKTPTSSEHISDMREEVSSLGPLSHSEKQVILALVTAILLWILPNFVRGFVDKSLPLADIIDKRVPEAVAVLIPVSLLFSTSDGRGSRTLLWADAKAIDWGTILLFGGSLALGGLIFDTGLAQAIGDFMAAMFGSQPEWVFLTIAVFFTILLSETSSNTACAALVIPIVIATCKGLGYDPLVHTISIGFASSLGFMLPVASPMNSLAYSTGKIPVVTMIRTGFIVNLIGWSLLVLNIWWLYFIRDWIIK